MMELFLSSLNLTPYFNERTESGLCVFSDIPALFREDMLILFEYGNFQIVKGHWRFAIKKVFINQKSERVLCVNLHALSGFAGAFYFQFKED